MNMTNEKSWTGRRGDPVASLQVIPGGLFGRPLPHSVEAEQNLLAACMLDGRDVMARCREAGLRPAAFFVAANAIIFERLLDLDRRQQPTEVFVVAEELQTAKQLDVIGGYNYLVQVSRQILTTAQAGYYVEKVKEQWILRELAKNAAAAVEACFDFTGGPLEELLLPLATRFNRAIDYARANQETMKERAARGYARTLLKLEGKHDKSRQLLTGMGEFDERFGAFDVFEEDFLIGVGALTSGGKSAFTRKICDRFLQQGKRGLVFLLETTIAKWLDLAAGTMVRVNGRHLDRLVKEQEAAFRAARAEREEWVGERLWIYDDSLKAETLCACVEDHVRRHGAMDFVVVDHLHELYADSNKYRGQREQELGFIVKELKKTAKRLNTPFFVPTQLNRSSAKDGVLRRPTKHDLRGSGEIENAFDRLILLHIPREDMRGAEQTENQSRVMIEVIQDKSRNGPIGRREFWFDRPFTDFVEIRDHEFERKPNTPGGTATSGGYKR